MSRFNASAAIGVGILLLLTGCGGDGAATNNNVAADCEPEHEFETIEEGTLTVGVYDLPPYASTNGPGGMSGVDADIVREIAERECLSITAVPSNAPSIIPSVQQGRTDLGIGDWNRTKERVEMVSMSAPLYLDQMGIMSEEGISEISELEGKAVGTIDGYLWVEDLQQILGGDLRLYPSSVNLLQDLKAGRIEVGIDAYGALVEEEEETGLQVAVPEPDPRVGVTEEPGQAGFPMSPDNQAMLEAFNEVIADLHEEGRIAEILEANGLDPSAADVGDPRLI